MIDDTDSAYLQVGTLLSSTGHLFVSFSWTDFCVKSLISLLKVHSFAE